MPDCSHLAIRLIVVTPPFEMLSQMIQRIEGFAMQLLSFDQRPLLKCFTPTLHKLREEVAAIQRDRLLQALRTRAARFKAAMRVRSTRGDQLRKDDDID